MVDGQLQSTSALWIDTMNGLQRDGRLDTHGDYSAKRFRIVLDISA